MTDDSAIPRASHSVDRGERELRRILADLQREYEERAHPIVAALVRIEAMRPVPPFMVLAGGGIDLDALKAAALNSRENSERLLARHRESQAQRGPERTADDWVLMPRWLTEQEATYAQGAFMDASWSATECFAARYGELIACTQAQRDRLLVELQRESGGG